MTEHDEMIERMARAIDPKIWHSFDDYAEHRRWSADEKARELAERAELSTSLVGFSLSRAKAALASSDRADLVRRVDELAAALEPFAQCPSTGKHGGRFVIAKAIYDDGDASPREAHWHMSDFDNARAALKDQRP
jgi:hypothetical protein